MNKRVFVIITGFFLNTFILMGLAEQYQSVTHMTNNIVGWHWYNELYESKAEVNKEPNAKKYQRYLNMNAAEKLKLLQKATEELKARAVLSGKVSDIADYKRAQDMWVEKASRFTLGWEQMLLKHPELNYALKYPHENRLVPLYFKSHHQAERKAIDHLAKHYGMLFFYRGGSQQDRLYSKVIKDFTKMHHISLIPVSVDGIVSQNFKGSERYDTQRKSSSALGITYFPALVLVNPVTGKHKVISYGFMSQDELSDRMLTIYDDWKQRF